MPLHPYQRVAVEFLRHHPRSALFLDMGLGKTAVCLSALTPDHLPALVIAPKRVAETVWHVERDRWRPDLTVGVAKGRPQDRRAVYAASRDVTVLGRDNIADLNPRHVPYRTIILDELSGFKSGGRKGSARWKLANKLVWHPSVRHVWGLTGTPSPNGLLDLWGQIYLLDKGERLGQNLTTFRSRYFTPGHQLPSGTITSWDLREGADEKIHRKLEDIALSMESDGRVDLPPVTFNTVKVELPPKVRQIYKDMKKKFVVDLELIGGGIHTAGSAAMLSNRLSQISAGFLYADPDDPLGETTWLHREKIKAVEEIVEGTGSPVLVFYRYRAELEALRTYFPTARELSGSDASETVNDWNAGRIPILLAHPASAGHGLNLQHGGHTVVWTTLPWSLEEWEQANKRLARQGQRNPVIIHTIAADRTVDALIAARLAGKADVQDALLEHLESPL